MKIKNKLSITMDLSGYFQPVDGQIIDYKRNEFCVSIGDVVETYWSGKDMPEVGDTRLVMFGIDEDRGSVDNVGCATMPDNIRHFLYRLARPLDEFRLVDLGNIERGETVEDTYNAVQDVATTLLAAGCTIIVLGGSEDLMLPIYCSYEALNRVVNIASIDSMFNLDGGQSVNSKNYLRHIIARQPSLLFDYVNIGYQTYFCGNEMIKMMEGLNFTTHRVGEIQMDIEKTEPLVRYCDIVSVDVSAMRQSDAPANAIPSPHGLYGEQLCQIMRYAGVSDKTSCVGFFEANSAYDRDDQTAHMLAHAIWFFIEGFYFRMNDDPRNDRQRYKRFTVQLDEHGVNIEFYKSMKSDRWWMYVPCEDPKKQKYFERHTLIPCSYSDYTQAMNNDIPNLWWHYYNRFNG